VERVARGVVIAAALSLVVAVIAGNAVLSHGSGTYAAILIFAPILLAPGALVFWRPRASFLSLWAVWSFIASLMFLLGASGYRHERALAGWQLIQWSLWIAIVLAIVGATIVSFAMTAQARAPLPVTPRTRRVQQATQLSVAIALVTVVVSVAALRMPIEGDFWTGAFIGFVVAPASFVHRVPRRSSAILWAAWTSPFGALMAILSLTMSDHAVDLEEPLRMSLLCYGTLMTMICIVLPVVAFISSDEVSDLPSARVH
jgi:hypothetical protein